MHQGVTTGSRVWLQGSITLLAVTPQAHFSFGVSCTRKRGHSLCCHCHHIRFGLADLCLFQNNIHPHIRGCYGFAYLRDLFFRMHFAQSIQVCTAVARCQPWVHFF